MRACRLWAGGLLLAVLAASSGYADVKTFGGPRSLRDLTRVGLKVDRLPAAVREEGLNEQEVQKGARERLRAIPLQVLSEIGALHLRGRPTLHLLVSLREVEAGSYVYTVDLELHEDARIERLISADDAPGTLSAATWRALALGTAQKGQLRSLSNEIDAVVDAFVKDFQAREGQ
jgi:hypothetical protein